MPEFQHRPNRNTPELSIDPAYFDWWDANNGNRSEILLHLSQEAMDHPGFRRMRRKMNSQFPVQGAATSHTGWLARKLYPLRPYTPNTVQRRLVYAGLAALTVLTGSVVVGLASAPDGPSHYEREEMARERLLGDIELMRQAGTCAAKLDAQAQLEAYRAQVYNASGPEHEKDADMFSRAASLAMIGSVGCTPQDEAVVVSIAAQGKHYDVPLGSDDITMFDLPDLCAQTKLRGTAENRKIAELSRGVLSTLNLDCAAQTD